jgi:hypothetical protein
MYAECAKVHRLRVFWLGFCSFLGFFSSVSSCPHDFAFTVSDGLLSDVQLLKFQTANLTFMASAADMAKLDAWRNERQVPKAQGHWGIPKGTG